MARSRDYAAENAAREARAIAEGYESAYDRRMHDFGRIPPSEDRLSGEAAATARGHRGEADFERQLHTPWTDPDTGTEYPSAIASVSAIPGERNSFGQWVQVTLLVEMRDGTTREYRLQKQHLAGPDARDHLDSLYYDLIDNDVDVADRYEILAG